MSKTILRKNRVLALLKGSYRFKLPSKKFKVTKWGIEELAPPVGSQPLPRWARGPLSVP
jgi:hypothetical protein